MLQNVPISEIMTEDLQVVKKTQPLKDVLEILNDYSVEHVPVVEAGKLVGLISRSDVLDFTVNRLKQSSSPTECDVEQAIVDEAMQFELITLAAGSTVLRAAEILSQGSIHSILVVSDDGGLRGIVTSSDLIKFLMNQLDLEI